MEALPLVPIQRLFGPRMQNAIEVTAQKGQGAAVPQQSRRPLPGNWRPFFLRVRSTEGKKRDGLIEAREEEASGPSQ